MLPRKGRESRVDRLKLTIMEKYSDNKGFPNLVGNIVVSATTGENIPELRDLIYTKALKAKDHIVGKGEMVIGKQVSLALVINWLIDWLFNWLTIIMILVLIDSN